MSLKKICLLLIIPCLFSCGEEEPKEKVNTNTPATKTASQTKATNPASGGNKKVSLGKVHDPAKSEVKEQSKSTASNKKSTLSKDFFESSKLGFKIKTPENWDKILNQAENIPVVFLNRPKGSRVTRGVEIVSVAVEGAQNVNLDTYYNYCKNQLIQSGESTGIVEESIGKNSNGQTFKRIIFNRKLT